MKRAKVLVIDDEEEFATALAERLKLRGYEARAVFNAEDAVGAVLNNPPQVIVLDVKMPGISGIDVFRAVRQIAPGVEVIVLSGHGGVEVLSKEFGGEKVDCAIKPVDFDELRDKIDRAAEKYAARQAGE